MAQNLNDFLATQAAQLVKGPIAIILCEDDVEIDTTLSHAAQAGFKVTLAVSSEPLSEDLLPTGTINVTMNTRHPDAHVKAVNAVIQAVPENTWMYYGYNAEYLFFPFSESRRVGEMLTFHTEERRRAMLTYVIDLYAADLSRHPNAVSLGEAMFDQSGYYALGRQNADGEIMERQLDFHGGLRWRFEEFIPEAKRRIDRIALFRTEKGLRLLSDHRFNFEEYNTYACPWHHNLTAAITSFRVAKALARNPGSRHEIGSFRWRNSRRFEWRAQQLMDLGLMEPGQWF
ncbi:hypothetical protein [Paracoccus sp. SCSIO 75233]|uniref:hypothetical protein n=1 Tax=Paracoccus sp. SCSIO 75233 TaxID=3017782 RepID=UPI0022EFDECC|nr:hypothetical protein [Paracoccus sp. SCSIO 75233]WBU52343.1 hypothetical protein PAF12_10930 [Paracoccus sp. SCSIO 75233]